MNSNDYFISIYQQEFLAKDGCYYMANIGFNQFNKLTFSLMKTVDKDGLRTPPTRVRAIYGEVIENRTFKSAAGLKLYVFRSYYKVDEMEE